MGLRFARSIGIMLGRPSSDIGSFITSPISTRPNGVIFALLTSNMRVLALHPLIQTVADIPGRNVAIDKPRSPLFDMDTRPIF
uniref:Uncharacterized protein n=1 Tax=Sinocyclocheilus anshuiensis TaxID=1608454 RepID=A0A671PD43_9TELE